MDVQVPVNYLAVLACGVVSMVLGFLWYGPLFGKTWARMMGWENIDPVKREEMKKGMYKSYALTFLGSLVMAYVLAHTLEFAMAYMKVDGVAAGLSSGFWMWLGFIAPVTLGSVLWDGKPWKMWFLNNGFNLLQLLVFGAILASWK